MWEQAGVVHGPGEEGGYLDRWVDGQSRFHRHNSIDSMDLEGIKGGSDPEGSVQGLTAEQECGGLRLLL